MRNITLLVLSCAFFFHANPAPAWGCTVFTLSRGGAVLFAGVENEEPRWLQKVMCGFTPPDREKNTYGYFTFFYNGNIAAGMNEKGLCFDIAGVPPHPVDRGNRRTDDYIALMLASCATVDEAVALAEKIYWLGFSQTHLMIADASGASVVLEGLADGLRAYRKELDYQVMTNYLISDPKVNYGGYPCWREQTAAKMLMDGTASVESFTNIIQIVDYAGFAPLYSYVFDLKARKIYIYYFYHYEKAIIFDLMKELSKGTPFAYLSALAE